MALPPRREESLYPRKRVSKDEGIIRPWRGARLGEKGACGNVSLLVSLPGSAIIILVTNASPVFGRRRPLFRRERQQGGRRCRTPPSFSNAHLSLVSGSSRPPSCIVQNSLLKAPALPGAVFRITSVLRICGLSRCGAKEEGLARFGFFALPSSTGKHTIAC